MVSVNSFLFCQLILTIPLLLLHPLFNVFLAVFLPLPPSFQFPPALPLSVFHSSIQILYFGHQGRFSAPFPLSVKSLKSAPITVLVPEINNLVPMQLNLHEREAWFFVSLVIFLFFTRPRESLSWAKLRIGYGHTCSSLMYLLVTCQVEPHNSQVWLGIW